VDYMKLETINPATGKLVKSYKEISAESLMQILEKSHHAYLEWRMLFHYTRAKYFKKLSQVLAEEKSTLAEMISIEMGKPLIQASAEVDKCIVLSEYYATNGPLFLEDKKIATEARSSYVTYQPLGIILGIMPWNFPLWQVLRFAVPTIMAGNSVILKHSPNVCGVALLIEELFHKSGFPDGVFKTVLIDVPQVESVIANNYVHGVSLTGSEAAGRSVAALAGKYLKKVILELGGSDPYIVFHDADIEKSVETCVSSRMINCGQTCISAKRFLVDEKIVKPFTELFVEKMKQYVLADSSAKSSIGPMARKDLRDSLHLQVEQSVEKGAKVLLGGIKPASEGYFYPPTVIGDAKPGMKVWDEETFGPVAAITSFTTEMEALRIAMDTPYGLGAALFSEDIERMEKLAKFKVMAGSVFINDYVRSDPRLPFGGIKASGFGRELSNYGLLEFVNVKTIYIK